MKKIKRFRRNTHQNNQNTPEIDSSEENTDIKLETFLYFPTAIHATNLPEFLNITKKVADEYLTKSKQKLNPIYPVRMSESLLNDERLQEFREVIVNLGWDILDQQGYDMKNFQVILTELWAQQHHKHSLMEQHVHNGDQLVGFYMLKVPKDGSRPVFYDPRPAKVITDLPLKPNNEITTATNIINFTTTPGRLFITNTFLSHSFTKNASNETTEFIHFNMKVIPYFEETCDVEII